MMTSTPFFKPVPGWDMDTARRFIEEHAPSDYQLIDVRQPDEFATGHLPGAKLIPLGELGGRLSEIARDRPALVYCRSGGRAGNGVALLTGAGYEQAFNIGGIMQWEGLVATGAPEAGMAWFDAARAPEEYVALAWFLEEGARRFYLELAGRFVAKRAMFEAMARGEEQHRETLAALYRELVPGAEEPAVPAEVAGQDTMEGGMSRAEAVAWIDAGSGLIDALELTAVMEANAHDRYIRIGRGIGAEVQRAFEVLAEAEKSHQDQLMTAFAEQRARA